MEILMIFHLLTYKFRWNYYDLPSLENYYNLTSFTLVFMITILMYPLLSKLRIIRYSLLYILKKIYKSLHTLELLFFNMFFNDVPL